jgi:hypothetical protein
MTVTVFGVGVVAGVTPGVLGWDGLGVGAMQPGTPSIHWPICATERRYCTTNCTGTVDDILKYGYQIGCFPGIPPNATSHISRRANGHKPPVKKP